MGHIRLVWIDILKGIGIMCVVYAHIFKNTISDFIFIFHMPLFFWIGGFLYSRANEDLIMVWKKTRQLLIPYCTFLLLLYAFKVLISKESVIIHDILWGGQRLAGYFAVFWFITCYWFSLILFAYMEKYIPWLQWLVLLFFIISFFAKKWDAPLNIDVALASIPFVWMGYKWNDIPQKFEIKYLGIISVLAVIFIFYFFPSLPYDMKYSNYGIPMLSAICAIMMIYELVQFSKSIEKFSKIAPLLNDLGKASLVIMYAHMPIQLMVNKLNTNEWVRFILSLTISWVLFKIFQRFNITRKIFLGQFKT